jgi:phosphoglycerol transferase MdoB-like AlkP superfamily enzyme
LSARWAHEVFIDHGDQPFFAVMLSTSNHSPFEFPEGRIELYEQPQATRLNAMKYADYAIGEFFRLARSASYYENTIFLVVADHDACLRENDLVPIDRFLIPGLIIGPDVPSLRYDVLSSQLNLPPTLLHFTGLTTIHPMLGHNLMTREPDARGHAFMQYGKHNAYRIADDVVIMLPEDEPRQFKYIDGRLLPATLDEEFARDALAHSLLPWKLYQEKEYRLP